jgi:poly-gamma-glutamate capsule biosynthesis protein CapA/YwtB (metallophosphatase superfamily)
VVILPGRIGPPRRPKRVVLPDAMKAGLVALAVIAACVVPLVIFLPSDEAAPTGLAGATTTSTASTSQVSATSTTVPETTVTTAQGPIKITIAAVGDVMGVQTIRWAAWDATAKKYDFFPMFKPVAPYLQGADYAVANLETRLADPGPGGEYLGLRRLNSPQALGEALKQAGVDLCATANNHSLDMGFAGIVQTLDRLDAMGMAHIGDYRSLAEKTARQPFIVDIKGVKVAFLNYTDVNNGLYLAPKHRAYAVNFLGTEAAAAEAKAAREAGADVVVMLVHWGKERKTKQNSSQVKVAQGTASYQGLLERGVDVILGAHPHVVQPAARVTYQTPSGPRDTYVVYSMGNFLSGADVWPEDSGVVMYVHIEKSGDKTTVTGLSFLPVLVQKVGPHPQTVRILPVLPGLTPQTDTTIATTTKARMDKVWNYYKTMYDKPQDNIVPLDPGAL